MVFYPAYFIIKRSLHVKSVDPATVLKADLLEQCCLLESEAAVEVDARGVIFFCSQDTDYLLNT